MLAKILSTKFQKNQNPIKIIYYVKITIKALAYGAYKMLQIEAWGLKLFIRAQAVAPNI